VTGDVLTQKAKELALIPELEVSEGFMLFGLAHEFQEAPWHQLSGPAWRGRLGSRSQRPARSDRAQSCWRRCRTRTARTRECGQDTFNMDESGLYWAAAQSHAGARADWEIRRTRSA
jgi:hypothetical protein